MDTSKKRAIRANAGRKKGTKDGDVNARNISVSASVSAGTKALIMQYMKERYLTQSQAIEGLVKLGLFHATKSVDSTCAIQITG